MIEVNSLVAVFVVEGLAALFLLVVITVFFMTSKKSKERSAVKGLVHKLKDGESSRKENLSARLSESCVLDESTIDFTIAEVDSHEKILYQQIMKMFLGRDAALLLEIDKSVQALSEPFCQLLAQVAIIEKVDPTMSAAIETANVEIKRLRGESERLTEQLSMAMQTMDEVSSEYSKMFGSSKNAEELDVSCKRMLNTYKRAEEKMRDAFMEQTIEEMECEEL